MVEQSSIMKKLSSQFVPLRPTVHGEVIRLPMSITKRTCKLLALITCKVTGCWVYGMNWMYELRLTRWVNLLGS